MKSVRLPALIAASLAACTCLHAAAATESIASDSAIIERLATLERKFEELASENRALREQLAIAQAAKPAVPTSSVATPEPAKPAKPAPIYVSAAGKEDKLTFGGFFHINGEAGGAPDARWNGIRDRVLLRRARLNASGSFKENISFKLEGDFGANSLSTRTGISAQLTDGYVEWSPKPVFVLRGGQFKTPFGFEQLTSDTRTSTVERSLPNDRLTLSRHLGFSASGKLPGDIVTYSTGLFNGTGSNSSVNDNDNFLWAGRMTAAILGAGKSEFPFKATAGINAFSTRDTGTFNGSRDGIGLDAQLAYRITELNLEWLHNESDPLTGASTTAEGWSALAVINLNPKWQAALRYETYDSNTNATSTTSSLWTLGATYRIRGEDLKFTLNYLIGDPAIAVDEDTRLIGRMQVMF